MKLRMLPWLMIVLALIVFQACDEPDEGDDQGGADVYGLETVDVSYDTIFVFTDMKVSVFHTREPIIDTYELVWTIENESIATILEDNNGYASIAGVTPGETTITVSSVDKPAITGSAVLIVMPRAEDIVLSVSATSENSITLEWNNGYKSLRNGYENNELIGYTIHVSDTEDGEYESWGGTYTNDSTSSISYDLWQLLPSLTKYIKVSVAYDDLDYNRIEIFSPIVSATTNEGCVVSIKESSVNYMVAQMKLSSASEWGNYYQIDSRATIQFGAPANVDLDFKTKYSYVSGGAELLGLNAAVNDTIKLNSTRDELTVIF